MADDPNAVVTGGEGQVADPANPVAEGQEAGTVSAEAQAKIDWEKRYADSSKEAKRLYEENVRLKAEQDALAKVRSLNEQDRQAQQQQFVPRDQFVEFWTAKGATPEWAQARYDIEHEQFKREVFRDQQIQALANRQKFREELDEQIQEQTNPMAQAANAFWKNNAVMMALPLPDRIKYHKDALERMGLDGERSTRRDLTAVKQAAGGPTGGRSGGTASATAEEDAQAKTLGFPSARAMADFSKCTTAAEARAWEQKWKTKL